MGPELEAARRGDHAAFARLIQPFRRELRAHCYRMAGALHDADDLLQESLLRAWRGLAGFEGRAGLRTWLYSVTTHACLDQLEKRSARSLPQAMGPAVLPHEVGQRLEDSAFLGPAPAAELLSEDDAPEAQVSQRESVALAFLLALQTLTPKQRAALILRDVVGMEASECAEVLGLTIPSINGALLRAREVLAQRPPMPAPDPQRSAVLARYVEAWERADTSALVALLREDATLAMPPIPQWLRGAREIGASIEAMVFSLAGPGGFRLVPIEANSEPALAAYARDPSGVFRATALHLVDVRDGQIAGLIAFLSPALFAKFGLADTLA
ncbi:MAG: RNA polymerase subunit sigma-70 [Deltaproteobacteria bacterium]|nr:RNA polymerase subunit sigma-70 [Deltaproteobacteria bacterium]